MNIHNKNYNIGYSLQLYSVFSVLFHVIQTEKKLTWVPLEVEAPALLVPCVMVEFDDLITAAKVPYLKLTILLD
jgi:hypothetical protein